MNAPARNYSPTLAEVLLVIEGSYAAQAPTIAPEDVVRVLMAQDWFTIQDAAELLLGPCEAVAPVLQRAA